MADQLEEITRTAAKKLKLLNDAGDLKKLDSLNIIDLVVELEASSSVSIPSSALMPEHFASIADVCALLRDLAHP